MLRRTASAVFAAGMYVFPGGRVDDVDGAASIEPYCTGLDDAAASARLGIERGGLAYWVAAVRECFEEAGVLLARRRDGGVPVVAEEDRRAVHAGELSMEELCQRHDLVLDLSAMRYIAHWVTPIGERRRFDTRFFMAVAPEGQEGAHDDAELVDSRWVRPADAIGQAAAGELLMLPPTIATLQFVAGCTSSADARRRSPMRSAHRERIQPRLRRDAAGRVAGIAMPGDADFDDLV